MTGCEIRVSVVIPAYKAAHTISRAIDSALAQTYLPHEILVVDDGSPDNVAEVVEREYGSNSRVKLIRKPNGGAASARNMGLDNFTGDVVTFLDSDDHWEPAKLARQVEAFARHPEVGLVAAAYFEQEPGAERYLTPYLPKLLDQAVTLRGGEAFDFACLVWTGTVAIRREALGAERFASGLEPAEDRDLWIRMVSRNGAFYLSEPLATYVLEPNSLSRSNIDRDCGNMLRVVQRNRELLTSAELRRWEAIVYGRWAGVCLTQGGYRNARRAAWFRLLREPYAPKAWWIFVKSSVLKAIKGN